MDAECKGYYQSEWNECIWKCECNIKGPWACDKYVRDNDKWSAAEQAKYDKEVEARKAEGKEMYYAGALPSACRKIKMDSKLTMKVEPSENVDRLIGYIEAMTERMPRQG